MTYGCKRPTGIQVRYITLDPCGNNLEALCARRALNLYGRELIATNQPRLVAQGQDILRWMDEEILMVETLKCVEAQNT